MCIFTYVSNNWQLRRMYGRMNPPVCEDNLSLSNAHSYVQCECVCECVYKKGDNPAS